MNPERTPPREKLVQIVFPQNDGHIEFRYVSIHNLHL